MTDNEKIIDKIKKLLRMKRGGTAAEIETALALAQKLAARHGIDINAVNAEEEGKREPITHLDAATRQRLQIEYRYAALIINRFFNVKSFVLKNNLLRVIFVGTKSDLEIAQYIFNFLVSHFRREWNTKRGRCRNRTSFMKGMYIGLYTKLEESEPKPDQQPGIILTGKIQCIDQYMEDTFGKLKSTSIKLGKDAHTAMIKGFKSGLDTNIRKAVTTTQNIKLLIE